MATYLTRRTWNPNNEAVALSDMMDRLMRSAFVTPAKWFENGNGTNFDAPAMDVTETADGYTVKAALPGWKPEDVDVTFENGVLTVKGEWKTENEQTDEKTKWHAREIRMNSFQRSIQLPTEIEADKAKAEFQNGVLTLAIPKAEIVKPKQIKIAVK
jgi:HSP20 family protein